MKSLYFQLAEIILNLCFVKIPFFSSNLRQTEMLKCQMFWKGQEL